MMKHTFLLLLAAFAALLPLSAHDDVVRVHAKSGEVTTLSVAAIDSLYFSPAADQLFIRTSAELHRYAVAQIDSLVFGEAQHQEAESEVARVELLLAGGHFHGVRFHQDPEFEGMKFRKAVQRIVLERTATGWRTVAGSDAAFRVLAGSRAVVPYGLWVKYYNAQGEEITGSFQTGGADRQHQHFFTAHDVVPTFDGTAAPDDGKTADLFQYNYMDTDPWDGTLNTGALLIGSKQVGTSENGSPILEPQNAIGLKGWFNFKKPRKQFTLNLRLMHAPDGKYVDGKCSPYHAPTKGQLLSAHWDVDLRVPVIVYADQSETGAWISDSHLLDENDEPTDQLRPFDQLTPEEQKLVRSTAKAYGCTLEEAMADWFKQIEGTTNPESGSLWF